MKFLTRYLREAELRRLQRAFPEGATVTRFVAKDVKREILVLSAARIDEGIILARCRTTNVLYVSQGLSVESPFDDPREIQIAKAWSWTGESWGGRSDGTSLATDFTEEQKNEK